AQLELAVRTARQQRDTAEALRLAMTELTTTLDPAEVLDRLRDIVGRAVSADRVCLVEQDGPGRTVVGGSVTELSEADAGELFAMAGPVRGGAEVVPAAVAALLGGARPWLVVPLHARGGVRGVLVAGTDGAGEFDVAQLDMAAAMAG